MTTQAPTRVSTWSIDPVHSSAEFAVKHMMISTVRGRFRDLEGAVHIDEEDPTKSWVTASIDAASVDTSVADRDTHLRSDDFLNAEKYPRLTFRSTRVERVDDEHWKVIGDLAIREVTRQVVLDTEFEGQIKDVWGKQRAAFTAETVIERNKFGLNWNALIEAGGVAVGDKIKVTLNIAAVRQDEAA
jgi:polyisoprenoid-binding protein YceI